MYPSPIVLFVYSRPWHTQQTVEALLKNELASESELFVFCDGAKSNASAEDKQNINEVRNYIRSIKEMCPSHSTGCSFKSVIIYESNNNKGLADSIISGVTEIVNKYGKIIVVEDDIVTSPYFLRYMNDALNFYVDNKSIFSVNSFNPIPPDFIKTDVFTLKFMHCWGWSTWSDRWKFFEKKNRGNLFISRF